MDKSLLREIEHLRKKVKDEQLEAIKNVLDRSQDAFSRHKDIRQALDTATSLIMK